MGIFYSEYLTLTIVNIAIYAEFKKNEENCKYSKNVKCCLLSLSDFHFLWLILYIKIGTRCARVSTAILDRTEKQKLDPKDSGKFHMCCEYGIRQ